jgi:hypothetical protein
MLAECAAGQETTNTHTLAQNCHCEFCCGMHLTCRDTSNQMIWWKYICIDTYIYIYTQITGDDDDINQQRYNIGPPAATSMRPGERLYIYIYVSTFSCSYRKPATFPFPLMPTVSLRVVGHECHTWTFMYMSIYIFIYACMYISIHMCVETLLGKNMYMFKKHVSRYIDERIYID